jgi:hypothetical protein
MRGDLLEQATRPSFRITDGTHRFETEGEQMSTREGLTGLRPSSEASQ